MLIKEKGEVQLRRCGVKFIEDQGIRKIIGLYKINMGDPNKIHHALIINNICGFDGLIFAPIRDNKNYWHKIRIHRAKGTTESRKKEEIIHKEKLPMPYKMMPDRLLEKIEFFNVYPESNHVTVVYIVGSAEISDCEVIFDYIYKKARLTGSLLSEDLKHAFNKLFDVRFNGLRP